MLPTDFQIQMQHLLGPEEARLLCDSLTQSPAPVSVRLNALKPPAGLPAAERCEVLWCAQGRYLAERPAFAFDPLWHAGCYYVQEASSMFVEQAYRTLAAAGTPRRVLDLCAAPGGKSTLWRSLLPEGSLLVANEPVRARSQILAENLTKWGHPDVVCTSAYPDEFAVLGGFFDVVAADVPCSGEGMFRKDAGAIAEWSTAAVEHCAERQWQIVNDVWPSLRQGGYLVYSTCTFNRQENEDNVWRICQQLGAEPVPIAVDPTWNIAGDTTGRALPVYHFFPHRAQGEGLFLALLRKTAEAPASRARQGKRQAAGKKAAAPEGSREASRWLTDHTQFELWPADEAHLLAVRATLADEVRRISQTVKTLTAGILLAERKGRKLIPQHALALSSQLRSEAFPQVELSRAEALAYLRREALTLPPDAPRGYVVPVYDSHPLGFLNNLGSRANNLYPPEWRLRSVQE